MGCGEQREATATLIPAVAVKDFPSGRTLNDDTSKLSTAVGQVVACACHVAGLGSIPGQDKFPG